MTQVNRQLLKSFSQKLEATKNSKHELRISSDASTETYGQIADDLIHLYAVYEELFHSLQDIFLGDHKSHVISQLESTSLSSKSLQIGLHLLNLNKLEKPLSAPSIIPSITPTYWHRIIKVVYANDQFRLLTSKIKMFYKKRLDSEIDKILEHLPLKVDPRVQEDFRRQYYQTPLSFDDFLEVTSPSHHLLDVNDRYNSGQPSSTVSQADKLRDDFEKALEKKQLDQEKKSQSQSFDNYQTYFQMDEHDLQRIKRDSKKRSKKSKTKKSRRGKYQK